MRALWAVWSIACMIGPIILGFFFTSDSPRKSGWFILVPISSLLGWLASLACIQFGKVTPAGQQRVLLCHVAPSLL